MPLFPIPRAPPDPGETISQKLQAGRVRGRVGQPGHRRCGILFLLTPQMGLTQLYVSASRHPVNRFVLMIISVVISMCSPNILELCIGQFFVGVAVGGNTVGYDMVLTPKPLSLLKPQTPRAFARSRQLSLPS